MSQTDTGGTDSIPAAAAGLSPPYTLADVLEARPAVGAAAFDPNTGGAWIVLYDTGEPAAEYPVASGGVLTEWLDCEADERVYRAVAIADLQDKAIRVDSLDDLRDAVTRDRVLDRAVPESRACPLPAELADDVLQLEVNQ
jgi:hypothetical protein